MLPARVLLPLVLSSSVALSSCAGQPAAAPELFWLFNAKTLTDLPSAGDDSESVAMTSFVAGIPRSFRIDAHPSADVGDVLLTHIASGTKLVLRIREGRKPDDNLGAIKEMLAWMHEGYEQLENSQSIRVEFVSPLCAASTAKMDGRILDGLTWWRPGGRVVQLKVFDKPHDEGAIAQLFEDARQLLADTDAQDSTGS